MKAYSRALMWVALLMFLTSGVCSAQVYKCISQNGKIEFSNVRCSSNAAIEKVNSIPNTIDMSASREHVLKGENIRLREQLQEQQRLQRTVPSNIIGRTQADLQFERLNSYDCQVAKSKLEASNKIDMRREKLAMYAACGLREPDRTNIHVTPQLNITVR